MIKDLKTTEPNILRLLINNLVKKKTKNNKDYYQLTFIDNEDEIKGFLWDVDKFDFDLKQGDIVIVEGLLEEYNNLKQIKIINIKKDENQDPADFIKRAPLDKEEIKKNINNYLNKITDKDYYNITLKFLKDNQEYFDWPAAKVNHHEYISGLSFHTLTMLELANSILNVYKNSNLNLDINESLLYSAIILHDSGKTKEMKFDITTEYSLKGKLLGHINIAANEIQEIAKELNISDKKINLLTHCILSHHGRLEYGSPILPSIIEAEILSLIDDLDAKVNMIDKHLKKINKDEWTTRIFGLDNRSFFKHK